MMRFFIFLCSTLFSISVYSQLFRPVSKVQNPPLFNTQLRYTASLLNEKKPHVRVLIYGQSISVQEWWNDVRTYFEKKYPNAKFTFANKAIGGFSAERLKLTTENDIVSFYPDLILFHDYGNEDDYEKIIRIIRSKTTADIAIQTDHMADQSQEWHDRHSEVWLPELCEKYGLALLDIRKCWKNYLNENNLDIKDLLADGVHLNDHGNYLMAEIVKAYFNNLKYEGVPQSKITKLQKGKDFSIKQGSITIPFTGNRVDISSNVRSGNKHIDLLVDGISPKENGGYYYYTRPTLKSTGEFLTRIGSLIAIELSDQIQEEDWSLTVLSIDSVKQEIKFALHGSITGSDGIGTSTKKFTSNSGKITIYPEAWFVRRHDGDFSQYRWIKPGDVLQWETKSMCSTSTFLSGSSITTLIQGITNTNHQLKITGSGVGHIHEITVYSPLLEEHD